MITAAEDPAAPPSEQNSEPAASLLPNLTSCKKKLTPWPESARDRRFLAKLAPTLANRGCRVVSVTDPYDRILAFLDGGLVPQTTEICASSPPFSHVTLPPLSFFPLPFLNVFVNTMLEQAAGDGPEITFFSTSWCLTS
jgi:hypothetical protein